MASSTPAAAAVAAPAASSSSVPLSSDVHGLQKPAAPYTALVFGATGATGRALVQKLASSPHCDRVNAIVRREQPVEFFVTQPAAQQKIVQTVVADYSKLADSAPALRGYSTAFSCLGSTRAKAGSAEEFHKQDYGTIVAAAEAAKQAGVVHFGLCSSAGADATSIFAYLKTKGEIERKLRTDLAFPSLSIFRPGLLLTERPTETGTRWGEWIAQKVVPAFHWLLPEKHCGVYVQTVAQAMMDNCEHTLACMEKDANKDEAAVKASVGVGRSRIFENDDIRAMRVARL